MTPHHDQDRHLADILGDERDPAVLRLAATLSRAYKDTLPPHRDAAIRQALTERASTPQPRPSPARRSRALRWSRRRLAALVAALLLALGGTTAYLQVGGSAPASAEAARIAHRVATALHLAPNQAAHITYSVTVGAGSVAANAGKAAGGARGTADVWVQADAGGATTLSAQTLTMDKPGMYSRYVQVGRQVYAYNPEMRGDDKIMLVEGRGIPSWVVPSEMFDSASAAQELSTLASQSPQRVQALPQQTLDGHTVDVLEVDGWLNRPAQRTTFYVDAQSYVLRGFDATSMDPSYPMSAWQVRLIGYDTMPAAAVPPHTFTLNAPATAQVALPDLGGPTAIKALAGAFTATCHSTANLKTLLAGGQSPLAACQASAPGVTQAGLVAALAAPYKEAMDAAAAAGQITPAQEASSLTALQAWLTTWVAGPATASK